ncbi:signal transduction histidine kinase [Flammeovirgaceae bacterium 311]|nr:signal transduction histidine kinase [Flammeovirgaceae bacterium 311]
MVNFITTNIIRAPVPKGLVSVLLAVLFGLGNVVPLQASLPEQYKFSLIDINNGLPHNQIKCFLKDSRGYLWIGTAAGLTRYDGYQLKVFRYDSSNPATINGNNILKLFEDPAGKVWVQTTFGFSVFDPATGKFFRDYKEYLTRFKLPVTDVEHIIKDDAGNYWFVLTGNGLARYNPSSKQTVAIRHKPFDSLSLGTNHVASLSNDAHGNLWVIHRNGVLEKMDGKTFRVVERSTKIAEKNNQALYLYNLLVDSDHDIWVYTPGGDTNGAFLYRPFDKSVTHINADSPKLRLNNNQVRGVVEEKKGTIWVATDHDGINVIDKRTGQVNYIQHNNEVNKSLVHNGVHSLYKDEQGIIWVGTFKNGVNYYHPNIVRFPHYKHQPSLSNSLPYDDINAFAEDDKGNLWIGTNGGGLIYFNRSEGTYTRYMHDPGNPQSLANNVIVSLLIDSNKELWIGTYLGGLDRFNGKEFTHYKYQSNNPNSLSDNNVWELYQDSRGIMWVGTLHGGVNRYDPEIDGFHRSQIKGGEFTLHFDYISSITEDSEGRIWVGGGYGIEVFDLYEGTSTYLSHDPNMPGSMLSNNITSIHRDQNKNIWIATTEGLDFYDQKAKSFIHFTEKDGLPSDAIIAILGDAHNNLWLSTSNGVAKVILPAWKGKLDKKEIIVQNYDEADGLQGRSFNENAACTTQKGEIIFGGVNGYNLFHPDKLGSNEYAPQIVFTNFLLFNENIEIGALVNKRVILEKSLSDVQEITLNYNENVFSIEFAALNFFHPDKNKYKYKLEGFDRDWVKADNEARRVTYTNLDPGEYEFRVMAANNDGIWNTEGAKIKLSVLAPFWKTNAAYTAYVLLVLALIYLGRHFMLQRASSRFKIEQERREAHQLHELNMMKIRFLTNVSHEFRTPLSLILAPVEKLLSGGSNQEHEKQYQMIHRNAKRLLNLVNQLLDFRKLEVDGANYYPSEGNVIKFIAESVSSFSDLSEKKNISLGFNTSIPEFHTSFDMDKLEKILFNLLSNAFKFTPENGEIRVEVNCLENSTIAADEGIKTLQIRVKDTGIGVPKDKQDKIFERFFRSEVPSSLVNQGSGIGLSITKEFVKIHGGTIEVESEPGKGSCFTVLIPAKEIRSCQFAASPEQPQAMLEIPEALADTGLVKQAKMLSADKKPEVLLVEDNEDFRFYLKDNLSVHFTIIEAKNGKEGWQKALSGMPDLIVSDLMMPEMNGTEFCKKVKEDSRTSHIPFVLLTAHTAEEQKLKGLNIGANDYITKPFNFEILLSRLRNLITQRQQMQQVFEKKIGVQTSEANIVSMDEKLIQRAIKIVEDSLSDPDFSVEVLSKELGMSRAHLYKKMVSITGSSPVEFIRKIRLQRAAQFLEKSQLTVAEVAYKVGFNNTKYFSKYFKSEYNMLPSLYAVSKQHQ